MSSDTGNKNKKDKVVKYRKLNDVVIGQLKEVFAIDGTVDEACYYADISRQTFYNWKKAHPKLFDKIERLRQRPVLKARRTVTGDLDNPDMALKYLERKRKLEWSGRTEHVSLDSDYIEKENKKLKKLEKELMKGDDENTKEA